jgi:pimeloyl-ACP methyl ester carboxylesterase
MLQFLLLLLAVSVVFAEFKPLDAELSNYEYPYQVNFYSFSLKGKNFRMAFMDEKPKTTLKGTVVLMHGKNFSGNYWEKTAKDFLAQGYRVVIPDQVGFGKSSKPENFPYSFHYLAELTNELLSVRGIQKIVLVGHSMGGMLATRYSLMYPQQVEKLILVNPIGLEDWKTMVPYKNVNELFQAELQNNLDSIRAYQKANYFDGKWKPEYDKGIEIAVGWTMHPDYHRIAWNSALTTDMIFTQPVFYEFKNLSMPTLLIIGTRDRTAVGKGWADAGVKNRLGRYDILGKEVIRMIPRGTLKELPEIGHMPQIESYDSYWQSMLEFIQK